MDSGLFLLATDSTQMGSGYPHVIVDSLCKFASRIQKELGEFAALHIATWKKNYHSEKGLDPSIWRSSSKKSATNLTLESQMENWRDNPSWEDPPPNIKVIIPEGSLSFLTLTVDVGLPPDAVYDIVINPENKRVFKNIKDVISRKVLVDEGSRQIVEVEQSAIWRFLWLSGTLSINVLVDQNREDYTMKFKQIKSGFMEKFEGCWKMEPLFVDADLCHPFKPKSLTEYVSCARGRGRIGTKLRLEQLIQPAFLPPPPISWYLRGITTKTTEMLINYLLAETARIRHSSRTEISHLSDEQAGARQATDNCDIKEKWAMRRRSSACRSYRRLSMNSKLR